MTGSKGATAWHYLPLQEIMPGEAANQGGPTSGNDNKKIPNIFSPPGVEEVFLVLLSTSPDYEEDPVLPETT